VGSFVDPAGSFASACRGFRDMRRGMLQNPRQPGRECRGIRDNPRENVADSATTRAKTLQIPRQPEPSSGETCWRELTGQGSRTAEAHAAVFRPASGKKGNRAGARFPHLMRKEDLDAGSR
jgi:hypothetical protein